MLENGGVVVIVYFDGSESFIIVYYNFDFGVLFWDIVKGRELLNKLFLFLVFLFVDVIWRVDSKFDVYVFEIRFWLVIIGWFLWIWKIMMD